MTAMAKVKGVEVRWISEEEHWQADTPIDELMYSIEVRVEPVPYAKGKRLTARTLITRSGLMESSVLRETFKLLGHCVHTAVLAKENDSEH